MRYLLPMLLLAGLTAGCGESSPGPDATVDARADAGDDAPSGPLVTVTLGDASTAVGLGRLPTVTLPSGTVAVTLDRVIHAALPGQPLGALVIADLVAGDGYRAAARTNCITGMNGMPPVLPAPADASDRGYVNVVSRNLTWAEGLGFPSCMSARDLVEVRLGAR